MAQANFSVKKQHSTPQSTTNKCILSIQQTKLGIAYLEKWLQLINNAVRTVSHYICVCSKTYSIFCYRTWINNKESRLSMLLGLIWLSVGWEDWFILMQGLRNGCRLISEHLSRSSVFWGLKAECSKSKKLKEMVSPIWKLFSIENQSEQRASTQSVISWNTCKCTNLQQISSKVQNISINSYKYIIYLYLGRLTIAKIQRNSRTQ